MRSFLKSAPFLFLLATTCWGQNQTQNQTQTHTPYPNPGCEPNITVLFNDKWDKSCQGVVFGDPTKPHRVQMAKEGPDAAIRRGVFCYKGCILRHMNLLTTPNARMEKVDNDNTDIYPGEYAMSAMQFLEVLKMRFGVGAGGYNWNPPPYDPKVNKAWTAAKDLSTKVPTDCQPILKTDNKAHGVDCAKWESTMNCIEKTIKEAKICEHIQNKDEIYQLAMREVKHRKKEQG